MSTIPNILYRAPNLVVMTIPTKAGISKYRLRAHNTLTGAITTGATDVMFEINAGAHFKSPSVEAKGRGFPYDPSNTRGMAWAAFDPDDFFDPTNAAVDKLPRDTAYAYYTLQEFSDAAGAYLTEERRVFIVPPANFWGLRNPSLSLTMAVPQTTATEADLEGKAAPIASVKLHFPGHVNTGYIRNLENKILYYSVGDTTPMALITANGELSLYQGVSSELCFATTDAGGCKVSLLLGLSSAG